MRKIRKQPSERYSSAQLEHLCITLLGTSVDYLASFYVDWLSTSCEAERYERAKEKQVK
jgi:hypothetical protein